MIDIKFLRENPDAVKENIKKKFQDSKLPLVDEVIKLDAQLRKAQPTETAFPRKSAASWLRVRRTKLRRQRFR